MEKIGRARRKDPVQEDIVSRKDDLNKRTSALIKLLIDTKRSWNGKEAPDIGVAEPHRLTDKLPDETVRAVDVIDRSLDEIRTLLSGVKTLQDQYAAGFAEKAKNMIEQSAPVQAGLDSLLNKTASTALSRFWANVSAPFGMETGRWERLRMLRRLAEMMHNLKEIDEDILSNDPGVLDGLYKAKDLYINLRNDFFDDMYEYITSTSKDLSKEVDRLKEAIKNKDKEAGKKPIPTTNTEQLSSERSDKGRKKKKEKDEGERPSIIPDKPAGDGEPVDTSGVVREPEPPGRVPEPSSDAQVIIPPPPGRTDLSRMPQPPPETETAVDPSTVAQPGLDPNQSIPFDIRPPAGPKRVKVPGFRQPIEQTQTPAPAPAAGPGPMPQPPSDTPLGNQLSRLPPVPQDEALAPTIPIAVEPPETSVVEPEPPVASPVTETATEQAEPETGAVNEEDYSFAQAVPQNIRARVSNIIFHDNLGVLGKMIKAMFEEVYQAKGTKGMPSIIEIVKTLPKNNPDLLHHFNFFGERYTDLYAQYEQSIKTDKVRALDLGIMILANFDMMSNIIDAYKKNKTIPNPDDPSPTEGLNIWQSLVDSRTQDVEDAIIEKLTEEKVEGDWNISKIKAVLSKVRRVKVTHTDNNIVKLATTMLTRWLKRLRTNLIWDKRDRQLRQKLDQAIHKCLKSGNDVMNYLENRNMNLKALINTSEKFTDDLIYMFDKLSDIAEMYNNRMRIDKSKKKINKEKFNFDLIPQSQTYISRASDWLNAYKTKLAKLKQLEEDVTAHQQELAREKTDE